MSVEDERSPWRSRTIDEYFESHSPPEGDGSLFTRILRANEDRRFFVLRRRTHFAVLLHRAPYNNGHLLVVPYREVSAYRQLTAAEQAALAETLDAVMSWIRDALHPDGFNIGMNEGDFAESGEPNHLRVHVVPRWDGDTNFMSVVNDTSVVPESLDKTYDRLRRSSAPDG